MSWRMQRSAHPRRGGIMLLTAFLASATVPALDSWIHRQKGLDLERGRNRFAERSASLKPPAHHEVPDDWTRRVDESLWSWFSTDGSPSAFGHQQLFSSRNFDLFFEKCSLEGQFQSALDAPALSHPIVTRDRVELRWSLPEGVARLRNELGDDSLLRVGFRVYRWREGEEPALLSTLEVTQTYHVDQDLPLWRQKYNYCVFTVLEGRIGELPTLIESKRSAVIQVETLENFSLEVLDGTSQETTVQAMVFHEGEWVSSTLALRPGDPIAGSLPLAPDLLPQVPPAGEAPVESLPFDTGLILESVEVTVDTTRETRQRPEFLPDGRRKVEPASGEPTFQTLSTPVPVRTVKLSCRDSSGSVRTFASKPLR